MDDAAGGYFATNGGGLGEDKGKVYYLDPSTLEWEPLNLTYTQFLLFCFSGDLDNFYNDLRWDDWQRDVEKLDGDRVFNFVPMLWTKEGRDINKVSRSAIPVEEQYSFNIEIMRRLEAKK